jgi:hypothetical protein
MAEYLSKDLKMALSTEVEDPYNTMLVDAADTYYGMVTSSRNIYVPDKEKFDDLGKIGTGQEFATDQRSGYLNVPSLEISDELNNGIAGILFRRALGGAITVSSDLEASLGFYNHSFAMLPNGTSAGRQLPSSTILWAVGGADYMWGGVVVDQFRVDQSNSGVPTYTATLVGSGLNKRLRYLTANGALAVNGSNAYNGPYPGATLTEYPPTFPIPVNQKYMLGAESKISFTDTLGAYNPTSSGRIKAFSFTFNNAHRTDDRRPGDPRVDSGNQTSGNPRSGHYVNRMLHGDRTATAEMTLMLDDTFREYTDAYTDDVITTFKYTAAGELLKKAGSPYTESATDKQNEFEIEIPKSFFRSVRGADDNGDAVITMTVFPVYNGSDMPVKARMMTNVNAAGTYI